MSGGLSFCVRQFVHPAPGSYNRCTLRRHLMRPFRRVLLVAVIGLFCRPALAQTPSAIHTLLVVPFENQSSAPGLDWIGESFPEVLSQRMASSGLYAINRDDRTYAFDHAGIPATVHPSRATIYRIAEQMGADYVVMGNLQLRWQWLQRVRPTARHEEAAPVPAVQSSGALTKPDRRADRAGMAVCWSKCPCLAPSPRSNS